MNESPTRDAIITAARRLFGERGYTSTTIKDVAELAGYSPAMVMKVMGSKAQLYSVAAPPMPSTDEDGKTDEPVGYRLVRNIVTRRDDNAAEPWAMAPLLVHDAPDPGATRAEMRTRYLNGVAKMIGDTSPDLRQTHLVLCMLLGLAGGLRTFDLLGPEVTDSESLIQEYGALVQSLLDRGPAE
ncbi:TetR family transcriptional regulator [Streptosporangium sp. NPDC087985]|uniref:TetR/AcrR family transcriptional regulator n=1 Tax=Streptosporangium sp. NPDC087985 TaxID=3366196 RepID=UPI00382E9DD3